MKKRNGFTLIELLGTIVLISILIAMAVFSYAGYLKTTKEKAFKIEEKNLVDATKGAYADCYSNNIKNEFCSYHKEFDSKYKYEIVYLKELVNDSYINEIKDPYGDNRFCDSEKSYVYSSRKNSYQNNNAEMVYKVCLVCGDKRSEECLDEEDINFASFDTTCAAYYDAIGGTPYDGKWTDRNVYLSFGASGDFRYGIDEFEYKINNLNGNRIDANSNNSAVLTLNKTSKEQEYKVQAFDGMNGRGTLVSCGASVKIDKEPINSVNITGKNTIGDNVSSNVWTSKTTTLTANANPSTSTSGYLYQWYLNGEKHGNQTTSGKVTVTEKGTYKVDITNRVGKIVRTSSDFIAKVDIELPTCSLKVASGTLGDNPWYISDVSIDWNSKDGTGSNIISSSIDKTSITSDGKHTVTGMVTDEAGNVNTCPKSVYVDKTNPTVSYNVGGGTYSSNKTVTVTSDDTFYSYMNVKTTKNGGTVNDDKNITSKTKSYTLTHGKWKISTQAFDESGRNTTKDIEYLIDTVAPTCSLKVTSGTPGNNGWYVSGVTVGWNSTDGTGSSIISSNISQTSITSGGKYTITGTVTDEAGNVGTCSIPVDVENTVSTPTITYNGGSNSCSWKNNYNLTLASSAVSGISTYEIDWDNNGTVDTTTGSNFIPWNGYNSCSTRFRAVSNAGNRSDWTSAQHIHMDTGAPGVPTITYNGGSNSCSWKNNYNLTLTSSDNVGIAYYEIDTDNNGTVDGTTGSNFIPGNGWHSHTTRFRAVDHAGNRSGWTDNQHIHMDTGAPGVPSITYNGGSNSCSWKNNYNLTLSSSDNIGIAYYEIDYHGNGTVDETTGSNFIPPNGWSTCTAIFRAVDHAGNRSGWTSAQHIHMDTGAPGVPSITYNGGSNSCSWKNNYNLTLSSSDNIGIAYYEIDWDNNGTADTTTGSNFIPWNGWHSHTTRFRAVDHAGNRGSWTGNQHIHMDTEPPTCDSSGGSTAWTNDSRTLVGKCYDGDGNVSGCTGNASWKIDWEGSWTNLSPGTVYDNAGNSRVCPANQTVKIDKTPPSECLSSGGSDAWTNDSRTLVGTCVSDNLSGCSGNVLWRIDWEGSWTGLSPGTVYDNAGNSRQCPANQTVKIDKTAPSCTNSGDSTSWTGGNRTIYYGCSDSSSGCASGYTGGSKTFTTTTKTATIGSYTIKDNAGNTKTCDARTANVYVDKTPPTVTCSVGSDNGYKSNNAYFAVCSDNESGCINSTSDSVYSTFYPRISGFGAATFTNVKMTPDSIGKITWSWPYAGSVTVTGSYYDHVGNTSTCTKTVTGAG